MTFLVAVEGLNGVGKTTLARLVSSALGVAHLATPPPDATPARRLFDHDPFSTAAMLFYLSWSQLLSDEIGAGRHGAVVVCDRYVASTHAYFAAAGQPVREALDALDIRKPSLTVLVQAAESVRTARLAERTLRLIERATLEEDFRETIMKVYRSYQPLVVVDTTHRSIAEATSDIVAAIAAARAQSPSRCRAGEWPCHLR